MHATDRGLQMLLMRILGQGRASEILDSSDDTLRVDTFFRRMNWKANTQGEIDSLDPSSRRHLEAYCEGVNSVLARHWPWELKLFGYRPEEWTCDHSIMVARMVGYLTLVQSQAEIERLLVELAKAGVSREKLYELFPGILGGLDIDLLKSVTLGERIVPGDVLWDVSVPRMMASNNWVISGAKTASGKPIVANDPHLEANRLPAVWNEIVLKTKDRYLIGGSMPGFPGVLTGRTRDLAWGVTYAFVDAIDSWVEHCRDGNYYREEGTRWVDFSRRKEVIKRRKKDPVEVTFFENEHGVLDGNPSQEGYYLATRWLAGEHGAKALEAMLHMWDVKSIEEGMRTLAHVETGWNFVLATRDGEIAYQMSGLVPRRREGISGFVPLPGWKKENDWQGVLTYDELPRMKNPKVGFFATANQNLNRYGKAAPQNMPMASYRADRINDLLREGDKFTLEHVFRMHFDLYSLQAEIFMKILRPLLPETPQGTILRDWDCTYTAESEGAFLFERFYKELCREVFGKRGVGEAVVNALWNESGVFVDFYDNFDRVLLSERSAWFGEASRNEIFRDVAERALKVKPRPWKDVQQFMMTNILLGGRLPAALGFDRGPIVGVGGRATIHQGQIYRSAGRDTTFLPSFRTVTDLAREESFSNLAGGPSDRRFSKWYCSDLANWVDGRYKRIAPDSGQAKLPFEYREFDPARPTISDLAELARLIMIDLGALIEKLRLPKGC